MFHGSPWTPYTCCPLFEKAVDKGLDGINRCEMRHAIENYTSYTGKIFYRGMGRRKVSRSEEIRKSIDTLNEMKKIGYRCGYSIPVVNMAILRMWEEYSERRKEEKENETANMFCVSEYNGFLMEV